MKENGGFITYEDMKNHTSDWVEPVSINYRGYDVWELPSDILVALGGTPHTSRISGASRSRTRIDQSLRD